MAHKLMILARTGEGAKGEGDIFAPERIVAHPEVAQRIQGPGLIQAIEKLVPFAESGDGVAFTTPRPLSIVIWSRF